MLATASARKLLGAPGPASPAWHWRPSPLHWQRWCLSTARMTCSVWHLVLIRSAVFVVLLLPWWACALPEAWRNRTGLVGPGLAGTFMTLRFFYSFAHIPLAVGMALIRSFPIWVVLLLWVFTARRPTWANWRPWRSVWSASW